MHFFLNVTHVYKTCQSHTPITLSHSLLASIIPVLPSLSPHHTFWSCLMLLSTLWSTWFNEGDSHGHSCEAIHRSMLPVVIALKPWHLLPWLRLSEYPPLSVIDSFQARSLQTTLAVMVPYMLRPCPAPKTGFCVSSSSSSSRIRQCPVCVIFLILSLVVFRLPLSWYLQTLKGRSCCSS